MKEISLKDEYTQMCDNQEECKMCKYYDMDSPCELLFGYDKGRADAIEEIKESIIPTMYEFDVTQDTIDFCINILEQFKEKK